MEAFITDIEITLIGEMLIKNEIIPDVIQVIEPNDFTKDETRHVYSIIYDLFRNGEKIDPLIIANRSDDAVNCKKFLAACAKSIPSTANYKNHIKLIKDESKRQKALKSASELLEMLKDSQDIEDCRTQTSEVMKAYEDTYDGDAVDTLTGFCDFTNRLDKPKTYYQTGIKRIDETARISKGDYVVVGGRPSSGKTALTLQMMLNMAKTHRVVFFSLETSTAKIFDRLIANYTQTALTSIKLGEVTDSKRYQINQMSAAFTKLNLFVVNAAGWTVEQIKAKALQLKAEVIFIDYLGLIRSDGASQYERATRISMDLHIMAQKFKFTVIALVQLNRTDGEPTMSSLRDSGQIEQDADVILFLHGAEKDRDTGERKLIIAKNKEGECGAMDLKLNGETQRFMEVVSYG